MEFSRVTSGFSNARFHPILQTWRAHKGVDYAAPIGTPVRATGNGKVVFAGTQNGYGNVDPAAAQRRVLDALRAPVALRAAAASRARASRRAT